MTSTLIKGLKIYHDNQVLENSTLIITNDKITNIDTSEVTDTVYSFPSDHHLIPGMIDMHIHGANACDMMDATFSSLHTICETLPAEGTTAFLPTTMSQSINKTEKAISNSVEFCKQHYSGAEILGLHLEGPFVSKQHAGAQPKEFIIEPNIELFKKWWQLSEQTIKQVTIAPEQPNALELIKFMREHNIIASLGHSDADYQEAIKAIDAGCTHATHLFNAMRALKHREPNAITALLNSDKVKTEIIVDGFHLHPAIVELVLKTKTKNGVILVTDAMRGKCCSDGTYTLGGQDITVKDNQARLKDGTLAGSVLQMGHAIKNMMQFTRCSLNDIITMAAENPAKQLNLSHRKGSIGIGKDADLVVLDSSYKVVATF